MRFASLASGSRGNALLVEFKQTLVMVDCGLPLKTAEERLRAIGRDPRDIDAVLVTHEHADHVRGVPAFARRYLTPVWMTAGTATAAAVTALPQLKVLSLSRHLEIGDLAIEPFTVPHDAREPCQFAFAAGGRRLGLLSDTGHVTRHVKERLARCDGLAVEFNHDREALWQGSYPPSVKQRVASPVGHLDNAAAAELLVDVAHSGLQWVVALHLSEANNTPARVRDVLETALGAQPAAAAHLAEQHRPSGWFEIA